MQEPPEPAAKYVLGQFANSSFVKCFSHQCMLKRNLDWKLKRNRMNSKLYLDEWMILLYILVSLSFLSVPPRNYFSSTTIKQIFLLQHKYIYNNILHYHLQHLCHQTYHSLKAVPLSLLSLPYSCREMKLVFPSWLPHQLIVLNMHTTHAASLTKCVFPKPPPSKRYAYKVDQYFHSTFSTH